MHPAWSQDTVLAPESAVSSTIGAYLPSLYSSAQSAYTAAPSTSSATQALSDNANPSSQDSPSTTVTLSDAAKAYLASAADTQSADPPLATVAADARAWFDQQYQTLKIASAMLDGQIAVDLTSQSRATLSAVASNAGKLFSADESTAAGTALHSRFDDAMAPYVVIARHTGDYASLYQAASNYLDQAGADERATTAWQDQKQAVDKGLAAAKLSFGKAPDTGDSNDPVHALLGKTTASGSPASGDSTASVAANARAMLDDQENHAKDNGTQLSFDPSQKTGPQVDFSNFDNRTLATVALNSDSTFSAAEARSAKSELDLRTRTSMLSALTSGNGGANSSLGLLQVYAAMSDEEKAVLGVTDAVTNRVIQNYQTMTSLQNAFGDSSSAASSGSTPLGLSAYL
jgi:hypothetical protein